MKIKTKELDIDFIKSNPLSKDEEIALSEFIKMLKGKKGKAHSIKAA